MDKPILYRKRIIPEEIILLDKDEILYQDEGHIVTKWNTIKPKKILHHGCSCYFLKEGYKVSKFYRQDNSVLYWYCDIVDYDYNEAENSLTVTDLLADVVVFPDGQVRVVDLDEMADALEQGLITSEQLTAGLHRLNNLLAVIYRDKFDRLQSPIEQLGL